MLDKNVLCFEFELKLMYSVTWKFSDAFLSILETHYPTQIPEDCIRSLTSSVVISIIQLTVLNRRTWRKSSLSATLFNKIHRWSDSNRTSSPDTIHRTLTARAMSQPIQNRNGTALYTDTDGPMCSHAVSIVKKIIHSFQCNNFAFPWNLFERERGIFGCLTWW